MATLRKDLSMPGLLETVRRNFQRINDPVAPRSKFTLTDCLMSALAMFSLKFPSLLQFDQSKEDDVIRHNLKSLYQVDKAPCDTSMRERLDEVCPKEIRKAFNGIFSTLQRGKEIEGFDYMGHYLLSVDGTGYFSSPNVYCDSCCEKHHRNGNVTYYHQMLGAALVHPFYREVIPLAPEPILKGDGAKKNDCERNAAKRLLSQIRCEHPHLKLIVVEDGLSSNGPHIELLKQLNMRFILGARPKDHSFLFDWVANSQATQYEYCDKEGTTHRFRFINQVPLNDTYFSLEVNFLEYWELQANGEQKNHFSWVTDLPLSEKNVFKIMQGGRARWKIENETFNTLKNQGYHFEHNFGHGNKHLTTVFAFLMMLAFLIDQTQALSCRLFKAAQSAAKSKLRFWEKVRGFFSHYFVNSWEDLYLCIAYKPQAVLLQLDTS